MKTVILRLPEPTRRCRVVIVEPADKGPVLAGRSDLHPPSNGAGTMRSILLWFLGIPIPIIILIALFVR